MELANDRPHRQTDQRRREYSSAGGAAASGASGGFAGSAAQAIATSAIPNRSLASERDKQVLRTFARRIDATDAGAHNNLGVLYYNKGMYEEAVAAFMRALELDPRMQVAQRNLEIAYLNSGAADSRIVQLQEHLRHSPSDREARWELGRTFVLLGRHSDAIAEFTELLKYHPRDLGALIQLGQAVKAVGDIEVAQRWLEQALAVDPESSLVHFYLGEIAYNRGLSEAALERLERAIELNPQNHEALYLLGFVLGDAGRHEEAREVTRRAVSLNPSLSRAHANLAISQPAADQYVEKARRESQRLVQMEVTEETQLTHYNLGLAFRKKGYHVEALGEYRLALQRGEDRDLTEQAMAEVHLLRRDTEAALALYDALLQRQPQSPKLWNERGVALHQAGHYVEATESYRRAIECESGYSLALNNLGVALYHAGQPEPAIDAFRRALEAQPAFAKARLNQALLLFKGKRMQLALEAYRKVLAVDAEQPVAWNGVGLVLAELRKFADARNAFARAIQTRPDFAEAHYNLSFTLSNLGDFEGALRETRRALELDPYYVAQKFELAIDLQHEDPNLTIQPDLGSEKRADEAIEDFSFDPRVLDSLFRDLATPRQTRRSSVTAALAAEADPFAMAADFLSKGFFDRAQVEATRALGRGGDPARGAALLGDIFAKQGLWGEALERYREARQVSPDYAAAMNGEATALLRLGRALEARLITESVLQRTPGDIETLMLAAAVRGEAGDPGAALAALETARRVAPMRADVHKHIGDVARRLGDNEGAIAAYRNALALDPLYAVVRFQLALVLMDRQAWRDAEDELTAALDAVPTYGEATLTLAGLRLRLARPGQAMPLLIELLQRDPYHFDALIKLGETLLALGRKEDAVAAFRRVLRFDPRHVGALYHEGALMAEQHRYRDAIDRWRQVIEIAPSDDFARRARREIRTAADLERIFARNGAVATEGR
ncbi:MAG TPA: tetratricopeptide repeat protein [Gemmatimonadaceae bacterium]|nr:tetratricopeptide repeat protein [Gemmatimonadaceae bacterium]